MPRVYSKTKAKRGRRYNCAKCGKQITPSHVYYDWSFRYGGTRRQHQACGYPRRGQLTQSKLGAVYDAVDDAEDAIRKGKTPDDIAEALRDAAGVAQEISDEYREAAEAMGAAGESGTSAERADALESLVEELASTADDIEGSEPEDGETDDVWIDNLREEAIATLGSLDL